MQRVQKKAIPFAASTAAQPTTSPATPAQIVQHPSQPILAPIPDVMPGGTMALFAGASGVGKTAFVAGLVKEFLLGGQICGHQATKLPFVGVLAVDRRWDSHKQWFSAVGYPDIPHYSYRDDPSIKWEQFHDRKKLPLLFRLGLDKLAPPRDSIIIVDPLTMFIPGNLIDYKLTAVGLAQLDAVYHDLGVTIIGICHIGKQKNDVKQRYTRPQDRILGSAALAGFTDTQMYLLGPEETDEEYYQFGWVPHHAEPETFEFIRDERGLFIPYQDHDHNAERLELLAQVSPSPEGSHTHDLTTWAGEHLAISRRTTYRHLNTLERQGRVQRVGRGSWRKVVGKKDAAISGAAPKSGDPSPT